MLFVDKYEMKFFLIIYRIPSEAEMFQQDLEASRFQQFD